MAQAACAPLPTHLATLPVTLEDPARASHLGAHAMVETGGSMGQLTAEAAARLETIRQGFRINGMNMRDASTGKVLWENNDWDINREETEAQVPREILKCRQVSREINFSSQEVMQGLRLVQTVYFKGEHLEEWNFAFGFVIPNSTNTWQQTIEAAEEEDMIPAELLSGNIVMETTFYDGEATILTQKVRIYYV
uniref:GMP phosphodiesterase delta subunit domain-containing protein n=1 Tax=Alexandrium catenella TaxID=2925 RepID=A0A7S1PVQ4_ALECA